MKSILNLIAIALFLLSALLPANESRNGGNTVQFPGRLPEVGDLHFVPLPHRKFVMPPGLPEQIRQTVSFLYTRLNLPLIHRDGREFLMSEVFNSEVDYRLVDELPSEGCRFMAKENLPFLKVEENGVWRNVGCTDGSLTYLVQTDFEAMNLLQQALFIIHERLHGFNPHQALDYKMELVHALYVLNGKYLPALADVAENGADFRFSPRELEVLNRLPDNVRKLTGRTLYKDRMGDVLFTATGGLLITPAFPGDMGGVRSWRLHDRQLILGLGTVFEQELTAKDLIMAEPYDIVAHMHFSRKFKAHSISGMDLVVNNVQVTFTGVFTMEGIVSTLENMIISAESPTGELAPLRSPHFIFANAQIKNHRWMLPADLDEYQVGRLRAAPLIFEGTLKVRR